MARTRKQRLARTALAALALCACTPSDARTPVCSSVGAPARLPAALNEISGIAVSRAHQGILYGHNDSDSEPVVFAMDNTGTVVGRVRPTAAANVDWEDIAVGPCPAGGGDCIWIADIGDNRAARESILLYALPEPDDPRSDTSIPAARYRLQYPDGPRDAEALFVTTDRRAHIISKGRDAPVRLYRSAPLSLADTARVQRLRAAQRLDGAPAELPDQVTAATISTDGRRVLVRSYTHLQLYGRRGLRLDPLLPGPGVDLEPLGEPQGEGLAMLPDGSILLSSERGPQGVAPRLITLRCRLPS